MTDKWDEIMAEQIHENEFKEYFLSLTDPGMQIEKLANWRRFQTGVVSTFIEQIRKVAGDQYTNLDHFLLELLQNADDNEYKNNTKPTVELKLTNDTLILHNNEIGFTSENVFSITHNAASTKNVNKSAATFIGEKGVGFKSVFAVADYVDIHSGPYHFRLKNDEYIVPYAINPKETNGTEIVLKFKDTKDIPQILSKSLNDMCDSSHEFILFLQKIEKLNIQDNISGVNSEIIAFRDKKTNIYTVEGQGKKRRFITFSYKETMPVDVVTSRFSELHDAIKREVVFAVPFPPKPNEAISKNGKVFCFLPTEIETGTPIHLQVDAETTTNRANIKNFTSSGWNKTIFQKTSHNLVNVYLKLTENDAFKDYLPEYWPCIKNDDDLHNKDVRNIIMETMKLLKDKPVIMDHHGNFKSPLFVRRIPMKFAPYFFEGKYERALSKCLYKKVIEKHDLSGYTAEDTFFLVSENWSHKYPDQLESIGVKEIDYELCLEMLKEGVPSTVDINDDISVRKFLSTVMSFADDLFLKAAAIDVLKYCPIYPLMIGDKKQWGSLNQDIMQLKTDSSNPEGTFASTIIDPLYTYNPGGNIKGGDELRDFNKKFREFLSDIMGIRVFTLSEFLRITDVRQLKEASENPNNPEELIEIEKKWSTLYNKIWTRKKTTIKEHNEHYWDELIKEIGDCKIPVWMPLTKEWKLERVSLVFLSNQFNKSDDIEKEYSETNAPIINLNLLNITKKKGKSKKKKNTHINNLENWTLFLQECGAKTGPYLCKHNLSTNNEYSYSGKSTYSNNNNIFAKSIGLSISSHREFSHDTASSYQLVKDSNTYTLDKYTKILLYNGEKTDFVARKLSAQWDDIEKLQTYLYFVWGQKHNPRCITCNNILLYEDIRSGLILQTDKGFQKSSECFEDNNFNKKILKELGIYVNQDKTRYNKGLLQVIGVKEKVSLSDISDLIVRWYQRTSQEQRSSKIFAHFLEAIDRFFSSSKDNFNSDNITLLKLYSEQEDALLPYNEWKASISPNDYSPDIVQNLENNLNENLCKLAVLSEEIGIPLDLLTFINQHKNVILLLKEDPCELENMKVRVEHNVQLIERPINTPPNPDRRKEKICEELEKSTPPEKRPIFVISPTDQISRHIYLRDLNKNENGQIVCQICKNEMPFKKRDGEYYFEAVGAFSNTSIEHVAQYLALCPLCAAMYKEFIKKEKDEHAMHEFKFKLCESEELDIPISLGKLETTVRFVETHFIDIKQFLREDNKRKNYNLEV